MRSIFFGMGIGIGMYDGLEIGIFLLVEGEEWDEGGWLLEMIMVVSVVDVEGCWIEVLLIERWNLLVLYLIIQRRSELFIHSLCLGKLDFDYSSVFFTI